MNKENSMTVENKNIFYFIIIIIINSLSNRLNIIFNEKSNFRFRVVNF